MPYSGSYTSAHNPQIGPGGNLRSQSEVKKYFGVISKIMSRVGRQENKTLILLLAVEN